MPRLKLNDRTVAKLKGVFGEQTIYWDTALPSFGVQCSAKTCLPKSWVCQARLNGRGRSKRRKIKRVDLMSYAEAKAEAKRVLGGFASGIDPRARKEAGATLGQILDHYLRVMELKPRSVEFYRSAVTRHLGDWLKMPIASITQDMVEERHKQIAAGVEARDHEDNAEHAENHLRLAERNKAWPEAAARHRARFEAARGRKPRTGRAVANGTMRCLRALMNFAIERNPSLGANPVRLKGQWFKVKPRWRSVKDDDLPKFYSAVTALKNPVHRDYILLLLFTGLRRREAAGLRWADIDFKGRVIRIPDTKNNQTFHMPTSDIVHEMLTARRAIGDATFVFPSNDSASGHVEEPKFPLDQVAAECGIRVSVHDLRRNFCTAADSAEITMTALKELVNHSLGRDVTESYIQTSTQRLREPAQRVADKLKVLCGITKPAKRRRVAG
jgi:integrase